MAEELTDDEIRKKVEKWLDGPGYKWGFSLASDGSIVDGMCHTGHYTHEEIYRRWVEPQENRKHKKNNKK